MCLTRNFYVYLTQTMSTKFLICQLKARQIIDTKVCALYVIKVVVVVVYARTVIQLNTASTIK